jgi:putative transcriptional regulator
MSDAERLRLSSAATAAESEANSDPDNPPVGSEQLRKMALARFVRRARESTGLGQAEFAERYHISVGRLRDYEQARSSPDTPAMVYLKLILDDPKRAESMVASLVAGEA